MILQLKQMFAIRARNKITERYGELVDICILALRLHFWILSRVYFHGWKEKIHARERYNGGDKGREQRLIVVRNLNLMVSCLFQSKGIVFSSTGNIFQSNKLLVENALDYTNITNQKSVWIKYLRTILAFEVENH